MSLKRIFCTHKWQMLSRVTTESKMDQMLKQTGRSPSPRNVLDLEPLMGRLLIETFFCNRCGALRRFKNKI